jgi:hypothetical protein
MFEYEHSSKYHVSFETRELLLNEIEGDEFHLSPVQGKIMLNDIERIFMDGKGKSLSSFRNEFVKSAGDIPENLLNELFHDLQEFIHTDPKIPENNKIYIDTEIPAISLADTREEITETINNLAAKSETARLTLYVFRQMDKIDWLPLIKAAIERNPVCFNDLNGKSVRKVFEIINNLPDESIYGDKRLALPDEVWNFRRGDGIEKALLLADIIVQNDHQASLLIEIGKNKASLNYNGKDFHFRSSKSFIKTIRISGTNYEIY